jgi:lipoate-protein ligase B
MKKGHITKKTPPTPWLSVDLPDIDYEAAWELQTGLVQAKYEGIIKDDLILFAEHKPVFTLGRRGGLENLMVTESFLNESGIQVFRVERGGNITFHGPGQLVVYPIVNLRASKLSVVGYVGNLEEVMIRSVSDWGIAAQRKDKNRGIWVGRRKIGSVGVAVRRGVAFHGVSLNVNISLAPFQWMHPCGLKNVETTSMENELAKPLSLKQVRQTVQKHFMQIFNVDMAATDVQHLEHMMGKKP